MSEPIVSSRAIAADTPGREDASQAPGEERKQDTPAATPGVTQGGTPGDGSGGTGWRSKLSSSTDLTEGPVAQALWRLAIPLAFGFIINAVYAWINMYFVSRLGDTAIAALGFSDQFNLVIFTLGSGFCIGTSIVVARRIGERRAR